MVAARFQPLQPPLQVFPKMLLLSLRRHPVDAGGPVFAGPPVRLVQPVVIHVMVQRKEGALRMLPGQFCSPSLFREHGIRLLSTGRVSLRQFYPLVSPSLPWVPLGGVSQVPRYYATLRLPRTLTQ